MWRGLLRANWGEIERPNGLDLTGRRSFVNQHAPEEDLVMDKVGEVTPQKRPITNAISLPHDSEEDNSVSSCDIHMLGDGPQ